MLRRPPTSTLTDTLVPYTTLFRSLPKAVGRPTVAADQDADLVVPRHTPTPLGPGDKPYWIHTSPLPCPDRHPGQASVSERDQGPMAGLGCWPQPLTGATYCHRKIHGWARCPLFPWFPARTPPGRLPGSTTPK